MSKHAVLALLLAVLSSAPVSSVRLTEIAPGARSASPQELTLAGPRLFFSADDGSHGPEPWALCLASPCSSSVP